jgi:hypothetical protein
MKTLIGISLASLALSAAHPAFADDQGYRFQGFQCRNPQGLIGFNPAYLGECGNIMGMSFQNRSFTSGTKFMGSRMVRADIQYLVAENADFSFSDLTQSNLSGAHVRGSNFESARMSGIKANFRADFQDCNFSRVYGACSDFNRAQLRHVNFNGANFQNSNFRDADFYFADMTFADFSGSDFRGADLVFADIFATTLTGAIYDSFTRLPFDRAQATRLGMIFYP